MKKFPTFHCARKFITACTTANHLSLSCARLVPSKPPSRSLETNFNIILPSTPASSRRSLPLDPSSKALNAPLLFPVRSTCPSHHIILDFITRIIFGEYRLCSSFKKEICASSTFICPVLYNFLPGRKVNYRCVQFKTRNLAALFVMYSQCGSVRPYVITRLSEILPGSFVLPEDGGSFPLEQTGNRLRNCTLSYPILLQAYMFIIVKTSNPTFHHLFRVCYAVFSHSYAQGLRFEIPALSVQSYVATVGYFTASMTALSHTLCNA